MEVSIYNPEGEDQGTLNLPEEIFGLPWNGDLVHQVVNSMRMNAREQIQHVRDRSEVRGGGKKPWRQKGTGRARHGSSRSPIWAGGGATFGPRNDRNFNKKINKKVKHKALNTILSAKLRDNEITFVDGFVQNTPKTKEASQMLSKLAKISGLEKLIYRKGRRALILTPKHNPSVVKSFQNIQSAHVEEIRNLNPLLALQFKHILVLDPDKSLSVYIERSNGPEVDVKNTTSNRSQVADIA